jgi:SpoVK/Ycf46/Vps4 family AAA+-type ATPase
VARARLDEGSEVKLPGVDLDQWIADQRPRPDLAAQVSALQKGAERSPKTSEFRPNPISDESLVRLIEPSRPYARWLRLVLLRLLLDSPAVTQLSGRPSYSLIQVMDFLGFASYERFAEHKTVSEIRAHLRCVLVQWEVKSLGKARFPRALSSNLQALGQVIELSLLERSVLGFCVLLHTEAVLESGSALLGADLASHMVPRVLAPALGARIEEISAVLARDSKLAQSGLLTVELRGRYDLRQLMDLMTPTFASRMVVPQKDIRTLVESFAQKAPPSTLSRAQFEHVKAWADLTKEHLSLALADRRLGVNILIYGQPGSGKSEFARVLSTLLAVPLMEIKVMSSTGAPIAPLRRLRNHRIAQSFFSESGSLLLFDECEEIFDTRQNYDFAEDESTVPRKSWLNMALESNIVPTIWIANSISAFERAYLRRFTLCFEMPAPKPEQALSIISDAFGDRLDLPAKRKIAAHPGITPALITQTGKIVSELSSSASFASKEELVFRVLNGKLKAQELKEMPAKISGLEPPFEFDPSLIHCDTNVQALADGLKLSKAGRLCIYGPPGTGKTAFGKWLAGEMLKPHLTCRASDLIGSYIGQTERNIAAAFNAAYDQGAVLQFDEVDSYLQDRSKASRAWEVSQVNEMLTQMEKFEGLFIASTNLFQDLDDASLRRFDMVLKFDFLTADSAIRLFQTLCEKKGLLYDQSDCAAIGSIRSLTAGDFTQLTRAIAIEGRCSAKTLVAKLKKNVGLKKYRQSAPVGFINA